MREFRIAANIKLPSDEFEEAAARIECGKVKAAIIKLLAEHKLTGDVTHETVTPRAAKGATPAAPTAPVADLATLAEIGTAVSAPDAAPALAPVLPVHGRRTAA